MLRVSISWPESSDGSDRSRRPPARAAEESRAGLAGFGSRRRAPSIRKVKCCSIAGGHARRPVAGGRSPSLATRPTVGRVRQVSAGPGPAAAGDLGVRGDSPGVAAGGGKPAGGICCQPPVGHRKAAAVAQQMQPRRTPSHAERTVAPHRRWALAAVRSAAGLDWPTTRFRFRRAALPVALRIVSPQPGYRRQHRPGQGEWLMYCDLAHWRSFEAAAGKEVHGVPARPVSPAPQLLPQPATRPSFDQRFDRRSPPGWRRPHCPRSSARPGQETFGQEPNIVTDGGHFPYFGNIADAVVFFGGTSRCRSPEPRTTKVDVRSSVIAWRRPDRALRHRRVRGRGRCAGSGSVKPWRHRAARCALTSAAIGDVTARCAGDLRFTLPACSRKRLGILAHARWLNYRPGWPAYASGAARSCRSRIRGAEFGMRPRRATRYVVVAGGR